jgi:hypothetical protein
MFTDVLTGENSTGLMGSGRFAAIPIAAIDPSQHVRLLSPRFWDRVSRLLQALYSLVWKRCRQLGNLLKFDIVPGNAPCIRW